MYVSCEQCGVRICVSELDYKRDTYPKLCPKCMYKPKKGSYKTMTEVRKDEDKVLGGEGDEVLKEAGPTKKRKW